ncbi:MAG: hypothetical protein A2142_04840 [candidate division Zixibacteria bacterium RBG_16_48_11]|nr:MAG: hypothetical protein A2142_04840 [candidate division Zixibacteria bacterium RBG_16_48_11]
MNDVALLMILALIIGEVWLFINYQDLKKEIRDIKRRYRVDTIKHLPPKTTDEIIGENLRPEDLES